MTRRILSIWVLVSFLGTNLVLPAQAEVLNLPRPGTMVNLSPAYMPVVLKGLVVNPNKPFDFDFIMDAGDTGLQAGSSEARIESQRLIKYFLAALTIPEKDLWVNLSPYEKNRMIAPNLGQTGMGRDMLAQDYILKQLTASLIYPEKRLGKSFWDELYTKARQLYGTTQIPVNTFNKVWIVADRADVYEHGHTAYIVGAHLKVMLEEDYLALNKNAGMSFSNASIGNPDKAHTLASTIIRQLILPAIEKEVNTGKNFGTLRQMFYSMILASWYKMALKDAVLAQVYGNQNKVSNLSPQDKALTPERIYQSYLQAYKKGVFNYIKEDAGREGTAIPRKYFSGGENLAMLGDSHFLHRFDNAMGLPLGDSFYLDQGKDKFFMIDGAVATAAPNIAGGSQVSPAPAEILKKKRAARKFAATLDEGTAGVDQVSEIISKNALNNNGFVKDNDLNALLEIVVNDAKFSPSQRSGAVFVLSRIRGMFNSSQKEYVIKFLKARILEKHFAESNPSVRWNIIYALEDYQAWNSLVEILEEKGVDGMVHQMVLEILDANLNKIIPPRLQAALKEHLKYDEIITTDPETQYYLQIKHMEQGLSEHSMSFLSLADEQVAAFIGPKGRDQREVAIKSVKNERAPVSINRGNLIRILQTTEPDLGPARESAVRILASQRMIEKYSDLILIRTIAATDTDVDARSTALLELGEIGDRPSVGLLRHLVQKHRPANIEYADWKRIQAAASKALGQLNGHDLAMMAGEEVKAKILSMARQLRAAKQQYLGNYHGTRGAEYDEIFRAAAGATLKTVQAALRKEPFVQLAASKEVLALEASELIKFKTNQWTQDMETEWAAAAAIAAQPPPPVVQQVPTVESMANTILDDVKNHHFRAAMDLIQGPAQRRTRDILVYLGRQPKDLNNTVSWILLAVDLNKNISFQPTLTAFLWKYVGYKSIYFALEFLKSFTNGEDRDVVLPAYQFTMSCFDTLVGRTPEAVMDFLLVQMLNKEQANQKSFFAQNMLLRTGQIKNGKYIITLMKALVEALNKKPPIKNTVKELIVRLNPQLTKIEREDLLTALQAMADRHAAHAEYVTGLVEQLQSQPSAVPSPKADAADNQTNQAMSNHPGLPPGGIDLNRDHMQINIHRDATANSPVTVDQAMVNRLRQKHFDGLEFHIRTITPLTNLPAVLGLNNLPTQNRMALASHNSVL